MTDRDEEEMYSRIDMVEDSEISNVFATQAWNGNEYLAYRRQLFNDAAERLNFDAVRLAEPGVEYLAWKRQLSSDVEQRRFNDAIRLTEQDVTFAEGAYMPADRLIKGDIELFRTKAVVLALTAPDKDSLYESSKLYAQVLSQVFTDALTIKGYLAEVLNKAEGREGDSYPPKADTVEAIVTDCLKPCISKLREYPAPEPVEEGRKKTRHASKETGEKRAAYLADFIGQVAESYNPRNSQDDGKTPVEQRTGRPSVIYRETANTSKAVWSGKTNATVKFGGGEATVTVKDSPDKMEEKLMADMGFDRFDGRVASVINSVCEDPSCEPNSRGYYQLSTRQIAQIIGDIPSDSGVDDESMKQAERSVMKLMGKLITIDLTNTSKKWAAAHGIDLDEMPEYLDVTQHLYMDMYIQRSKPKNGLLTTTVFFKQPSVLYQLAHAAKQIDKIPASFLGLPPGVKPIRANYNLDEYIKTRIADMRGKGKTRGSCKILYRTAYEQVGIPTDRSGKQKQATARKNILSILESTRRSTQSGVIDYQEVKADGSPYYERERKRGQRGPAGVVVLTDANKADVQKALGAWMTVSTKYGLSDRKER
jgi:hypothetical protein